jgi:hypothetical protein
MLTRITRIGLIVMLGVILAIIALPAQAGGQPLQPQARRDAPNATCPPDGQCFADVPPSGPFYTVTNQLYQQDVITGFPCGGPGERCDSYNRPYYRPLNSLSRQIAAQFLYNARSQPGILIRTDGIYTPITIVTTASGVTGLFSNATGGGVALRGDSNGAYGVVGSATGSNGTGVYGTSDGTNGYGVAGANNYGPGVYGSSSNSSGVLGFSNLGYGVRGSGGSGVGNGGGVYGEGNGWGNPGVYGYAGSGPGVYGYSGSGDGLASYSGGQGYGIFAYSAASQAGFFAGNVHVTGNLSKGGGSFKIDHPLDPENKYLYHSFVESPDMMNVYNGNVTLDAKGEATVQLPDWFGALNKEYRYQLTAIGAPGPNLYISKKVEGNRFGIAGGVAGMEVSWQVTGIRQDAYANAHRIPVEEEKTGDERGKYLHPTEWGQPESLGVDYEERQKIEQAAQAHQDKGKP